MRAEESLVSSPVDRLVEARLFSSQANFVRRPQTSFLHERGGHCGRGALYLSKRGL